MAGEIQIGGTTFATESGGTVTVANVNSATNRTNLGLGSIATQAADSVSISGGNITGGTIGSSVVFPVLGNAAVGTVSESSGTPTGDIVERGSNANGEFVKFADGTLICTFKSTAVSSFSIANSYGSLYQGTKQFTLPATYADTNFAVSCRVSYGTGASWSQGSAISTTIVQLQAWDVVSRNGTATSNVAYLTIGKWY